MFCIKCRSRIHDNAETKCCSECADKPAAMTVCDVWEGITHSKLKERHIVGQAEAFRIAQDALGRGFLVNLYRAPANGRLVAFSSEVAA